MLSHRTVQSQKVSRFFFGVKRYYIILTNQSREFNTFPAFSSAMAAPLRRARKLFVRAEDVLQQIVDSSDEELSPFEDEDESQDQDYQPQVRRNSNSSM